MGVYFSQGRVVMQLFFDHIAGKTSDHELIYAPASAIFDQCEYESALNTGWMITGTWYNNQDPWFKECKKSNIPVWYQSRITRIKTRDYVLKRRHRQRMNKEGLTADVVSSCDLSLLLSIYHKYLNARGFTDMYCENHPFEKSDYGQGRIVILYYYDSCPVAFSILDLVGQSAVATQFCWDYVNPALDLGKVSYYLEQIIARHLGIKYIYLGSSYESNSASKSNYAGFEWWDGRSWRVDKKKYLNLCKQDDAVSTVKQLSEIQVNYFSPDSNN